MDVVQGGGGDRRRVKRLDSDSFLHLGPSTGGAYFEGCAAIFLSTKFKRHSVVSLFIIVYVTLADIFC